MDLIADLTERLAFEERERERLRMQQFEELRSEINSVAVRVRAWERLYGLLLPTSPTHAILPVISVATGIPVAAIREEQRARRDARLPRPVAKVQVPAREEDVRLDTTASQQK
jgi:hypothetical protein